MLTIDQIASSQKANFDVLFGLTEKAFQGVEKMVELNLAAGKAALNESAQHAHALLSVKAAQELVALQLCGFRFQERPGGYRARDGPVQELAGCQQQRAGQRAKSGQASHRSRSSQPASHDQLGRQHRRERCQDRFAQALIFNGA